MGFGVDRHKLVELLKVAENRVDFNVIYLRDKELVELLQAGGSPWISAMITAHGIDVIEHQDNFKTQLPFIQTNIQNIHGTVNAPVVQAVGSQVNFGQQVTEAFKQARIAIEGREGLSPEQKDEIEQQLKPLEEELGKEEPDLGRVQKLRNWLRENANWIVPILATVISEGMKRAMG